VAVKTSTITDRRELDPLFLEPIQKILDDLNALYEEGYKEYDGERIADFTDKQKELTQKLYDQVGTYGDDIRSGIDTLKDVSGRTFDQAAVDQYMNPYIDNVLDRVRKRAYDADDVAAQKRASKAVAAGAFDSGDRRFIEEQGAKDALEDRLLDQDAKLMFQGYERAGDMFASDQDRAMKAASGIGNLATTGQNITGAQMAGAAAAADAEQAMNQAGLDLAYEDFQNQRAFPYEQLSFYMGGLQGFPQYMVPGSTTRTSTSPTMGQGARNLGLGINLLGMYGMGGGFGGGFSLDNLFGQDSAYWS
jgi:hypothetical protein